MKKELIIAILTFAIMSFNCLADWKTDIFGSPTKTLNINGTEESVGYYVEFRKFDEGGTLRRNRSSDYDIEGGYELGLGMTAPIRERFVLQVGGSLGSIDIINSDNNNEIESLTTFTIDAKGQQLNFLVL
jgi:hypothetical protein